MLWSSLTIYHTAAYCVAAFRTLACVSWAPVSELLEKYTFYAFLFRFDLPNNSVADVTHKHTPNKNTAPQSNYCENLLCFYNSTTDFLSPKFPCSFTIIFCLFAASVLPFYLLLNMSGIQLMLYIFYFGIFLSLFLLKRSFHCEVLHFANPFSSYITRRESF